MGLTKTLMQVCIVILLASFFSTAILAQPLINGKMSGAENAMYLNLSNYGSTTHGYPGYGLQQLSAIAIGNTTGNHLHVFVRGEIQDTAFNFVLFIDVPSKHGIALGTALPAGDNQASPFYAANIKLDLEADYALRINNRKTLGADSFDVSMIDYTNTNLYDLHLGTGETNQSGWLRGYHHPAGTQSFIHTFDSTRIGFFQSGNLSTNLNYGAEIDFNSDSLHITNGDTIKLFVYYTNQTGNYASMDCIPQVTGLSINPGANGTGGTAATATFSYGSMAGVQAVKYICNFITAPMSPSFLMATPHGSHHSHITWVDNANNETGYKIERSSTGANGPFILQSNLPAGTTSFSDFNQQPLDTFWYRVYAYNNLGPSFYSDTVICIVPDTVPNLPTGLIAKGISSSKITLSWSDNATNELSYMIEQSGNGSTGWVLIDSVNANSTKDTINNLLSVTVYYYRVYAKNVVGVSGYTNVTFDTTLNGIPFAPGNLTATAVSKSEIDLTWLDNSSNEVTFILEYQPDGGNWLPITLPFNTISYHHIGLPANTIYHYRISAVNALGSSATTTIATDTTFADVGTPTLSNYLSQPFISPNPDNSAIHLFFPFGVSNFYTIHIYNSIGLNLLNTNFQSGVFGNDLFSKTISVLEWPSGMYVVEIKESGRRTLLKFIKP